jgi:hypothetical protein
MTDIHMAAILDHGAACVRVARSGKRPLGNAWHTLASCTADVIGRWIATGYNVGLLLGHGGIIDIEHDDERGRETIARLGLADVRTPTYTSGRGSHRLFRLRGPVPLCGWKVIGGMEVRLGGKPAQSVLPPSVHPSGVAYRWTISPADCEPATITLADLGGGSWR